MNFPDRSFIAYEVINRITREPYGFADTYFGADTLRRRATKRNPETPWLIQPLTAKESKK